MASTPMQNLPSPALSQHIHFSAEPLSLAPGGRLRRKIRVGRERGHCVCWPCSKIPVLGSEQPLGWLKKLSAGTKPPPRAWLVPTAPASWGRGESVPCLEHPHTSRGSAPNFRAPQPCHGHAVLASLQPWGKSSRAGSCRAPAMGCSARGGQHPAAKKRRGKVVGQRWET